MLRMMSVDDFLQLVRDLMMMISTEPFYAVVFWVGPLALCVALP
jgi:hypothetical protein